MRNIKKNVLMTALFISMLAGSSTALAYTHCHPPSGATADTAWTCIYSMSLNPLQTKIIAPVCDGGVWTDIEVRYSGKKDTTGCSYSPRDLPASVSKGSALGVTCTNWKPIYGSDGFTIKVQCIPE